MIDTACVHNYYSSEIKEGVPQVIDINALTPFEGGKVVILGINENTSSYRYEGEITSVEKYDDTNTIVHCHSLKRKEGGDDQWKEVEYPRYPFKTAWYSGMPFNEGYILYGLIGGALEIALFSLPQTT